MATNVPTRTTNRLIAIAYAMDNLHVLREDDGQASVEAAMAVPSGCDGLSDGFLCAAESPVIPAG